MFIPATNSVSFVGKMLKGLKVGAVATIMVSRVGEVFTTVHPKFRRHVHLSRVSRSLPLPFVVLSLAALVSATDWRPSRPLSSLNVPVTQILDGHIARSSEPKGGFAAVATALVYRMPESPWWFMSKGRSDAALKALNGLGHNGEHGRMKLARM